jgi:hypothetical protein
VQAGVFNAVNKMSLGWTSNPTTRVVEAAGAVKKVKVWTMQVIVTVKLFVSGGTLG